MPRTTIRSDDITDAQVKTVDMAVDPTNASNLSSGSVPLAQLGNAPATDTSGLEADIALLAFKTQANGSLARYNLVDQTVDAFEDASGVDASASTGETRNSANKYYSGLIPANYFGSGTLGTCTFGSSSITQTGDTIAIDTVLTTGTEAGGPGNSSYGTTTGLPNPTAYYEFNVLNKSGSYDGDMLVANFANLTIDASVTLSTDQPTRGMLIYVDGDCVINGALSMTARGGYSNPTSSGGSDSSAVNASGLQLGLKTSGGSQTLAAHTFAGTGDAAVAAVANQSVLSSNGTIFTISRDGGAGGTSGGAGVDGATGAITLSTGGGGSGSHGGSGGPGAGGLGGCFGGGSASGSARETSSGAAGAYGAAGGTGVAGQSGEGVSGGTGNPGGASYTGHNPGFSGNGGMIWLLVNGDLTIGAAGTIEGNGIAGSTGGAATIRYGGAATGGGAVFALYTGTLTNNGAIEATEGIGGYGDGTSRKGGDGGTGGVHTAVVTAPSASNMTLVSNAQTAQDGAPTKGDLVVTYTNGAGTAVVGTDIKFYISRDGTNYTGPITMASQGTTGGHTILTANDVSLTSTSGTSMRWKIETLNQTILKETRVQAVSLGWS